MFGIIIGIALTFTGIWFVNKQKINIKSSSIIQNIIGRFSKIKTIINDDKNTLKGKRDTLFNKKEELYDKCVNTVGEIGKVKYEIDTLKKKIDKAIDKYNKDLKDLENGNPKISKQDMKLRKRSIESKKDVLINLEKRLEKLEQVRSHYMNNIDVLNSKISNLDFILKDIDLNKDIKEMNEIFRDINKVENEIDNSTEIDDLIHEAEKMNEKYKAENEFEESYFNIGKNYNEDEDISIDELRFD